MAVLGISAASAAAAPLYEPFNYPAGTLGTQGGWSKLPGATSSNSVVDAGSLSFGSVAASGNKLKLAPAELATKPYTINWDVDGTHVVSFMLNKGNNASGGDYFNSGFANTSASQPSDLEGQGGLGSGETYVMDWVTSQSAGSYAAGSTVLGVVEVNTKSGAGSDQILLWYYDTAGASGGQPGAVLARQYDQSQVTTGTTSHMVFTVGSNVSGNPGFIDEIRAGEKVAQGLSAPFGLSESFDYATGPIGTQGGWRDRPNFTSNSQVVENSLEFGSLPSSGNKFSPTSPSALTSMPFLIDWDAESQFTATLRMLKDEPNNNSGGGEYLVFRIETLGFLGAPVEAGIGSNDNAFFNWGGADVFSASYNLGDVVVLKMEIATHTGATPDTVLVTFYDTPDGDGGIENATPLVFGSKSQVMTGISSLLTLKRGPNVDVGYFDEINVTYNVVPEPSTWLMAIAGAVALALGWLRRRRSV